MVDEHTELFEQFRDVHTRYQQDSDSCKEEFNAVGAKVLEVIRHWEKLLCAKSESGQYGKFSQNLAEKFWSVIRIQFPKIDFIGVR